MMPVMSAAPHPDLLVVHASASGTGEAMEVAAAKTPTGKYAVGRGYSRVTIRDADGISGAFHRVRVHFER
jgi:hypothetical protein